jgi:hypothetical protein
VATAGHLPTPPRPASPPPPGSFPRLELPPKAVAAAKAAGRAPDVFYCLKLLEDTGIVTVPGTGFGQAEGTFHLRTTILPREDRMKEFVQKFRVRKRGAAWPAHERGPRGRLHAPLAARKMRRQGPRGLLCVHVAWCVPALMRGPGLFACGRGLEPCSLPLPLPPFLPHTPPPGLP